MGVRDRAALAIARMDQTRREMAERRAMRDRNTQALRARTSKAMRDRVPGMIEAAKQAANVAQRRGQAGGWATTNTDRDRHFIMGFGLEDENTGGYRPPAAPAARPPASAFAEVEEAQRPVQPAQTPPPAAPTPPPARPARERPTAVELDDEDDFSNQSSWLRNQ
jgi:hypothetical protein